MIDEKKIIELIDLRIIELQNLVMTKKDREIIDKINVAILEQRLMRSKIVALLWKERLKIESVKE